jgi:hypothetical protein
MADNTNTPKPEQIEALTRAEQILKDQIESTTKVRFKSNEEFRKTIELNTEYYKKLNDIEIALDGQLDLYSEINKKVQDFGKGLTDNIKKAKLQSNTQLSLKGIYSSLNSLQGRLISNQEDLLRGELSSNDVTKDILKNRLLEQNLQKTSKGLNSELNELNNQILAIEEKKQKAGGYLQWSLQQQLNKLNEQKIAIDGLIVGFQNAENAQKDITKELEDQLDTILAIEAHTGVAGKLLKGFSKIPILGDMLDIQGAQKAMNIAAANGTKGFSLLGKGISALGPSLKTALGPLGLILMAADAIKAVFNFYKDMLFRADEQATKLAKTLSVSKETAFGIRREFIGMADSLTTQYNTAESLIDAQSQVSDISKFNFRFSQDILDNQIILTKEIGLSADEATKLNRVNILNNVEGNKGRLLIEKQVVAFTRQTGLYASAKKILQEVSKVSGQILLNFRGNIPALTNAVLQAEKFGLSLEQSRTISDSLLDFESSISNELEAGVFLGRRFNLEQARSLALRKDYVGATEEVLKQVGSIEEFERMSAIHQQVIAKASGMTVDQLSESLMYTQVIGNAQEKNIQKLLKAGDKDLAFRLLRNQADEKEVDAAIRTITAQEKFNIALERAKDIFSTLVTDGTLDSLAEILKSIVDSLSFLINKDKVAKFKVEGAENLVKDIKQQVEEGKIQTTDQQTKALQELAKQKRTIEENIYFGDTFVTLKQGEYRTPTAEQAETIKSGKENLGLIDKINAALEKIQVGNPKPEIIKDGYSDSSDGPFEIKNKYGQTAVTAVGDKIAVSPNMSFNNNPTSPTLDLTPFINAFTSFKNDVITAMNRPQPAPTFVFEGNGTQLGKFVGSQMETGTAQNISTGYIMP